MARLDIYVNEANGQTVSKFGKAKDSERIVFHNQHATQPLTVSVIGVPPSAGIPLCDGQTPVSSFTVSVADKKAYRVCDNYLAETFKYTATIQGAAPEDPIIIIERKRISSQITAVLTGAAVGVVVGFVLGASFA